MKTHGERPASSAAFSAGVRLARLCCPRPGVHVNIATSGTSLAFGLFRLSLFIKDANIR